MHFVDFRKQTRRRIAIKDLYAGFHPELVSAKFTNTEILLQWSPLVWSTDVRSTPLYGQFLAGPDPNGHSISKLARL